MEKITKLGKIISEIHKKSINREIEWEEFEENAFQLRFPNSSVSIQYNYDNEAQDTYLALEIYNKEGIRILEIHSGNIKNYVKNATNKMLAEIHSAAKESVLKTDETLDDIFNSLESGFRFRSSSSSTTLSPTTTTTTTTNLPDDEDIPF
jgi:hypothetical protein